MNTGKKTNDAVKRYKNSKKNYIQHQRNSIKRRTHSQLNSKETIMIQTLWGYMEAIQYHHIMVVAKVVHYNKTTH